MNEIENRKAIDKNQFLKSQFFEKFNKMDKPLAKQIKIKTEMTYITNVGSEMEYH